MTDFIFLGFKINVDHDCSHEYKRCLLFGRKTNLDRICKSRDISQSEKVGLKLNIQKMNIMASGPITSWEIDGETVADFILGGSKITADGDCSHEIKRCLLLGRKVMTNLDSILEKAMAPHSSTLVWKIPWAEEPGGLQSVGLQRVGHD